MDPLPRIIYARHEDPLPWHIVKAQENLREAVSRREVEKVLADAAEKIKQRKRETLENLRGARDAAKMVTAVQEGVDKQKAATALKEDADRLAGDFVLDELIEELAGESDSEDDGPTAKGGGSSSKEKLPPISTKQSAHIDHPERNCMTAGEGAEGRLAASRDTFTPSEELSSDGSQGKASKEALQAAPQQQSPPISAVSGLTTEGGGECFRQSSPPNTSTSLTAAETGERAAELSTSQEAGTGTPEPLPSASSGPTDRERAKRLRELVKRLITEAPEGREAGAKRLIQQIENFIEQVEAWPEEIEAKPTRLMMMSDNDTAQEAEAAKLTDCADLLEALERAQQPDEPVATAEEGKRNDDKVSRKCLYLSAPVRSSAGEGQPRAAWSTPLETLLDSGASRDFINEATVKRLGLKVEKANNPLKVAMADGRLKAVSQVVSIDVKLHKELVYRTRAYVMGLGQACDMILGWSFCEVMQNCTFDTVNRALHVQRNGRTITLLGKGGAEAKLRADANALSAANPNHLEIISPEEGARDLMAYRKAARRAMRVAKKGSKAVNRGATMQSYLEQREPVLLSMQLSKDPSASAESGEAPGPEASDGKYRATIAEVQAQLRRADLNVLFHVDVSAETPQVFLINAEERDNLYAFGTDSPLTGADKPAATTVSNAKHQRLIDDILAQKVGPGVELDVKQYDLDGLAQAAQQRYAQDQTALVKTFQNLVEENKTLGDEFWTEERREQLTQQLVNEFPTVIREEIRFTDKLNENLEAAPIRLIPEWDGRAPFERARRMSPQELEVVRAQLAELLEKGYIVPSASPFGAAVMCIPKAGQPGKYRMVIDYRRLNALTVADRFPLPDIQELIDEIGTKGYRYWCSFDLASGFYNVPILEEHRERTAMSTPLGTYEWRVLPMGLKNAPSIFQRNMNRIFKDLPDVRCFVDDGVIGGETLEQLYLNVRQVLEVLQKNQMVVKRSKLQFFKTSLKFLGHNISREGVSPQAEKVEAVRNWPLPTTKSHLRSFLGLVQYYAAYIYGAADKAKPLHELTKDEGVVPATQDEWNTRPELLNAFNDLKYCLCHAPVLILPDYKGARDGTRPFLVQTDASDAAIGGVLMQDRGKGYQPIAFGSRSLIPAEVNYSVTEKELLALVHFCTEKWRHYLLGCQYVIQGDHRALITLLTPGRAVNRRQARWVEVLQEQNVPQMQYVPGPKLTVPDALSRRPDYMALVPTARQGLQAEPRNARQAGESTHTAEEDEDYFTSKTRAQSKQARHALMPAILRYAPKAPTLEAILANNTVTADPTLPAGVKPHGKVCSLAENGGGQSDEATQSDSEANVPEMDQEDLCRQIFELVAGIWTAPQGAQPSLPPLIHLPASLAAARDNQDWQLHPAEFNRWQRFFDLDVDGCADEFGRNAQLPVFWTDAMRADWRGKRVWCNPPYTAGAAGLQIADVIRKFKSARQEDPSTAACFILPYFQGTAWEAELHDLEGAECVYTYPAGTRLFYAPDGGNPTTRWPVQVWWCPPLREKDTLLAVQTRSARQSTTEPKERSPAGDIEMEEPRCATEEAAVPRLVSFLRDLQQAQREDAECQQLQKEIEEGARKDFRWVGNLLWRIAEGRYQLVLPAKPPSLRDRALRECHAAPLAGHVGVHKTLAVLRQRFWWANMARDVEERCRVCPVCQRTKISRQKPAAQLHQAEPPIRRWQEVSVDFVTGLALTARGYDAIMTVTDRKSKMVHFIPLRFKGSDSQRIARLFVDHVWRLHGMPLKLFSDRDSRFTSAFWKELCRLTGMMSGMTTAFHPAGNGQAERSNATMEEILRAYVGDLGADWDLHLSAAEYAVNNSPARATGLKPFVMMYGESPSTQLDYFVQQVLENEGVKAGHSPEAKKFVLTWQRHMRAAQVRILMARAADRAAFEKRSRPPHRYQVGQRVMLSSKAITSPGDRGTKWKLRSQYYGPLTITDIRYDPQGEPAAYQLELPRQWKVHRWFSEDKLKPFYAPDPQKWPSLEVELPPPTELVEGREEFVVDRVLGHRVERNAQGQPVMQWLISWKGYGPVHDEWRSAEDINTGGMELAAWREYEDRRRLQELTQRQDAGSNQVEVLDKICAIHEQLQREIHRYKEEEPGSMLPWSDRRKPLRVLVLYSGTGSVEHAILQRYPNAITVSVDLNPAFNPTHCCSVRQWMEAPGGLQSYPTGFFDIVWASPPCTEYSRAKTIGKPVPYPVNPSQPHRDLVSADDNVRAAKEVIHRLKPKYWFIENPVGYLVTRPVMQDINHLRYLCTYCRYGTEYQKATHIWTNAILPAPLLRCTPQTPCAIRHQHGRHLISAQSGDSAMQKGSGGAVAVYPIPTPLLDELIDGMTWLQHNSELGECSARLIESIWEGEAALCTDENVNPIPKAADPEESLR